MLSRPTFLLLGLAFLGGCDPGAREASAIPQPAPEIPAEYLQGRAGVVILAGQRYPFDVQTCAIGLDSEFMVTGSGITPEGQLIGVHADGNLRSAAVRVRRQDPRSMVAQSWRSRLEPGEVRVQGQGIRGAGVFRQAGGEEAVAGEFSISCGDSGPG